ncbi:heavy metal translocating P-type ATPase [Solidesulfovibrio fructosivorans JJ]]|uniref:P-type Zn(2+) transporter n=1 Tax=Solidesulfovibrio fructosivorans JJ] TaxID=596151 RepID=E1JUJ6_SOLFR|nr:cation-translocating P-type ATPase [Solidesulfovibrio fructosivorans]EFL52126.1 heavy metal translocating P-type ATPase [Solidesulfovibrio fructosivorans JJ]]
MIGRFSSLGAYKGLFTLREFYRCLSGGGLALAAFIVGQAGGPLWLAMLLGLASVVVNGAPIVIEAARGLYERRVNVDELVSLAIVASLIQGEVLAAAVISFIMTLGSLIEEAVSDGARRSIEGLAALSPQEAVLVTDDGAERTVPVADIRLGDIVLVRPGERIPVDAVIVSGTTAVDESALTGESLPRERRPGEAILAGTLNYTGRITARAVKVGEDTTFGKVVRLVVAAEAGKPRAARVVDRYARWFTPLVLFAAAMAWLFSGQLDRAVAVLVAGCPCALLMAAPTATVAAVGRAARRGILVKGGQFLEEAGRADVVLFDKTGTLTLGRPAVTEVASADGESAKGVIGCAACLERESSHPLAAAICDEARRLGLEPAAPESMSAAVGLGLRGTVDGRAVEVGSPEMAGGPETLPPPLRECLAAIRDQGATGLVVRRDGEAIGIIGVADAARETAAHAVAALRRLGMKTVGILSGDHEKAVAALAGRVGVTDVWAGLAPGDKLDILSRFQDRAGRVLFVGDGINDAPALARANVGVAMGAVGSDVALETADVALADDDIAKLPFLIHLGRRMTWLIGVNIGLGLLFNSVAIMGGAYGYLSPVAAAIFHNVGSVVVVLSSASLALTREPDFFAGEEA